MASPRQRGPDVAPQVESLAGHLKVLGNPKRLHLLQFLTTPHYIEEIASELGVARQTAQEHVQQLLDTGLVQRRQGRRESGPVTEFVTVPERLFSLVEDLRAAGHLDVQAADEPDTRMATQAIDGAPDDARPAPPLPRLVLVHGLRVGRSIPLRGDGPWLIGREPTASLCLDYDPFVSWRHAEVRREGGTWRLADLYSSNGTRLDFEDVDRGGVMQLENGSIVGVGRTLLLFRRPE